MTCDSTCDSVPALARQRKRLPCPGASHAKAGTESQVELQVESQVESQVITQVDTALYTWSTAAPADAGVVGRGH
jgi:hypothetical protein